MPERGGDLLEQLQRSPLVAILRASDSSGFVRAAGVLHECGITCIEVTLTSAEALDALREMRRHLPSDVVLGVGSVRSPEQAASALEAGAQFLVSPVFLPWMAEPVRASSVPFVPGALTPSEIVRVWDTGTVPAVKLSPVGPVGGADYVAQVHAPLPDIPLLPTGGIDLADVPAYLRSGAVAVGLGGPLLGDSLRPDGDLDGLRDRADRLVSATAPS